jgi:hypothetical protein
VVGGEHETVAGNGNRESDGAATDLSEAKVRAGLGHGPEIRMLRRGSGDDSGPAAAHRCCCSLQALREPSLQQVVLS